TEVGELGGLLVAVHPDDATVVVEVIVRICELRIHFLNKVRSSEPAQISRSVSTGASTTAPPSYWMRSLPSPVTGPTGSAETAYCAAIVRRAAMFRGPTLTMARAPRSPNRADSAGPAALTAIAAPSRGAACSPPDVAAKQHSATATAKPPSQMSWHDD